MNYENKLIYINNSYNDLMKERNGLIEMMNDTIDNHNQLQNEYIIIIIIIVLMILSNIKTIYKIV